MYNLKKSALFERQIIAFVQEYECRAGSQTALRFIDAIESAIGFIASKPMACGVYMPASKHPLLKQHEFRKWRVDGFPHSVFFRIAEQERIILLEALYAHRMDTDNRLPTDIS